MNVETIISTARSIINDVETHPDWILDPKCPFASQDDGDPNIIIVNWIGNGEIRFQYFIIDHPNDHLDHGILCNVHGIASEYHYPEMDTRRRCHSADEIKTILTEWLSRSPDAAVVRLAMAEAP